MRRLFAILRDGAPGEREPFLLQDVRDLQSLSGRWIFAFDDPLDALFDRHRRHALAERAVDAAVKEILPSIRLRGVHVFVVHHARDGRLVHADVVGDVAQDQRP
jgi:hypothetical protein